MTKFKIYFAVKSSFEFETEAETVEEAREKMNDASTLIEEAITFAAGANNFEVSDIWGGDEDEVKAIQDLTKIETTKAFRTRGEHMHTDTAHCPYCDAENTDEIYTHIERDVKTQRGILHESFDKSSGQFETDEANAKMFECTCWKCGQIFRVDFFKEV